MNSRHIMTPVAKTNYSRAAPWKLAVVQCALAPIITPQKPKTIPAGTRAKLANMPKNDAKVLKLIKKGHETVRQIAKAGGMNETLVRGCCERMVVAGKIRKVRKQLNTVSWEVV